MAGPYAFVTLVSSDAYLPGALAQVAALRDVHTTPPSPPELPFQTVCLVTPETLDVTTIKLLRRAFDLVVGVEVLEQEDNSNLNLLGRPDLTTVLTKLHVFRLSQYSKIIFLDADVLPIRPLSHLFNIQHEFAAAPDVGWPDIFNSGVLVLSPGENKFDALNQLLKSQGSWDGGDQGILNEWRAGDWHRLSFTYNTTPTAAYTYAPAYERYGSKINAIHFIGPNKPWNAIPYRSPFSAEKRTSSEPSSSQQTYNYDSLVDRWFAVYDKHYRSQPIVTPSFNVKRYSSAWDSPTLASSLQNNSERLFNLDELRRMAIEGMIGVGFASSPPHGQTGEGQYRSMPLDGRFDLMRPKKQVETEEKPPKPSVAADSKVEDRFFDTDAELPLTPMAQHHNLPDNSPRWYTLPTPGPNEFPPSPILGSMPLPSTPTPAPDYYASSAGFTSDSDAGRDAESLDNRINLFPHLFTQTADSSPTKRPDPHHHHHYHPYHHHHHHPTQHIHQHGTSTPGGQPTIHRPPSPPLISWNPAIEPPPKETPPSTSFPTDTYFTNVWDQSRTRRPSRTENGSPKQPSQFFRSPSPPKMPEELRNQGHYRSVIGEDPTGSASTPDPSKVRPLFPWEGKPRQIPGRVFPDSERLSPSLFVSPASSQSTLQPPKTPEKGSGPKRPALSPLPGLTNTLSYSNAWDNVPSIQDYAIRLASPPIPISDLVGNFDDDKLGLKNPFSKTWDEKVEANSQDGDVEDECEDNEDDDREVDSDDERPRERSRRASSVAEDTRRIQESAQKAYRSLGVQTIPREMRSQAVQIRPDSPSKKAPSQNGSRRTSMSSKRSVGAGGGPGPQTNREVGRPPEFLVRPGTSPEFEPARSRSVSSGSVGKPTAAPSIGRAHRSSSSSLSSVQQRPSIISTPTRAPEPLTVSTRAPSSKVPGPPKGGASFRPMTPPKVPSPLGPPARPSVQISRLTLHPAKAPSVASRQISIDSSVASPPSSVGPVSPPDDLPFTSSVRKGTRVWDPARGVDVFKRGSEEVLARFLKMGSWDENPH